MKWRVLLEVPEAEGVAATHEVSTGSRPMPTAAPDTIGLTLNEGKSILAGLQHRLVQAQAGLFCTQRRLCQACHCRRPIKDRRSRRLTTLFGAIRVDAPRFDPCRCGVASRRIVSPLAEVMPDRCTPEYERVVAKMGALVPYGRAAALMAEFLPLGAIPAVETARRRTLNVGARLKREALKAEPPTAPQAKSIALSVDGGHVKSIRSYQMRSFEILLAEARNDRGQHQLFSSVAVEADRERLQLGAVLRNLGATPGTSVNLLTDGAEGPRSLGEAASPGPTRHVLDWFHLAMRVQHVAQAVRSWPCATDKDRQSGALFAQTIERIRWRLWHGQIQRALHLIGDSIEKLGRDQLGLAAAYCERLVRVLQALEIYVSGQSDSIINYGAARRSAEPISTATTESAVQRLLHRRMSAKQQMRWSPRGAHLMLKVRTTVLNATFERDHVAAERWAKRPYRRAA